MGVGEIDRKKKKELKMEEPSMWLPFSSLAMLTDQSAQYEGDDTQWGLCRPN